MASNATSRLFGTAVILAVLGFGAVGCQRSVVTEPLPLAGEAAEMDFWHNLADRPLVSNNEAMHGLILLADGQDPNPDYEHRLQWLKERDLLSNGFDAPADQAVTRGTVAQIVARILKIKGGLSMRLVGPHPRYATRELAYRGILPTSTAQQGVAGITFLGIISRAETYQQQGSLISEDKS